MGAVTVITSGKGGVGKSTISAGLGTALARRGRRVLLIDGDAGLRSLDHMLSVSEQLVFDISDVIAGNCEPIRAIYPCEQEPGLFLLPAPSQEERTVRPALMRRLVPILARYRLSRRDRFDVLFGDCGGRPRACSRHTGSRLPAGLRQGPASADEGGDRLPEADHQPV